MTCCLAGLFAISPVSAQEPESKNQPIKTLYEDYNSARYSVAFNLNETNSTILRDRISRFWYLLLFAKDSELAGNGQAVVHFGFFKNRAEAGKFIDEFETLLGEMSIEPLTQVDHLKLMNLGTDQGKGAANFYWISPDDPVSQVSLKALLEVAKNHYVNKRYLLAAKYYQVMSLSADQATSYWARELMALSYEKMGDGDQAIKTYKALLRDMPEASGATRVSQRLRALETRADDGKDARRKSKYNDDPDQFFYRGGIGQTYRYVGREGKNSGSEDVLAIVSTNFDLKAGMRGQEHDFVAQLNGYNYYDLKDEGDDRNRIKQFNLNYTHKDSGTNVIGGRIRDYRSGVYSPFDGIAIRYPVSVDSMPLLDNLTIGFNYGEPVGYSKIYDDLDRKFFSLQAEYALGDDWKFSGYYTEQTVFGETDRKAYGGEVRYLNKGFSTYANFDYDYEFAEINNLLIGATYSFKDKSYVSTQYGRQRTPFLSASNILIGQPDKDLETCVTDQNDFECEYYQYFALLRSALSEHGSLTYSRYIDDGIQLTLDFYQSMMSEMPVLQAVNGGDDNYVVLTGEQYRYTSVGSRLIATNFFGSSDTAVIGVRFSDTSTSSTKSLNLSERFRMGKKLTLSPKFYLSYTERNDNDDSQSRIRGSFSVKYRVIRSMELFAELGRESYNRLEQKNSVDSNYIYAGYTWRF